VLERVEAEIGELGRLGRAVDADHAALVVEAVVEMRLDQRRQLLARHLHGD
jgi:hypothetical protein